MKEKMLLRMFEEDWQNIRIIKKKFLRITGKKLSNSQIVRTALLSMSLDKRLAGKIDFLMDNVVWRKYEN